MSEFARMNRRRFLKSTATMPLLAIAASPALTQFTKGAAPRSPARRIRPVDPSWPSEADWNKLRQTVEGRLIKVESPLAACHGAERRVVPGSSSAIEEYLLHQRPAR